MNIRQFVIQEIMGISFGEKERYLKFRKNYDLEDFDIVKSAIECISKEYLNLQIKYDENGEFKAKPQNVDVYWTNAVVMKVNKWLSVTYNLDMIYDDDVRQFGDDGNSAGLQVRSLLGVGLTTRF